MTSSNGNIFRVTGILCGNSPVTGESPHKGQWRGALVFPLICVWTNSRAKTGNAGDLRRHRTHYNVIQMVNISSFLRWCLSRSQQKTCQWSPVSVDAWTSARRCQSHRLGRWGSPTRRLPWGCSCDCRRTPWLVVEKPKKQKVSTFSLLQASFSNAYSSMKRFIFGWNCHCSLYLSTQLTIIQHWFR